MTLRGGSTKPPTGGSWGNVRVPVKVKEWLLLAINFYQKGKTSWRIPSQNLTRNWTEPIGVHSVSRNREKRACHQKRIFLMCPLYFSFDVSSANKSHLWGLFQTPWGNSLFLEFNPQKKTPFTSYFYLKAMYAYNLISVLSPCLVDRFLYLLLAPWPELFLHYVPGYFTVLKRIQCSVSPKHSGKW